MPHDRNNQILNVGDMVNLRGTIKNITSDQPTFCNIEFVADLGMCPEDDAKGYGLALSARMVEKVENIEITADTDGAIREDKMLRRELDEIIQQLRKSHRGSRERSIVVTKIQEAVMWLGMDLKDLGTAYPYPNSKDPSNTVIDPTADGLKL